MKKLRGVLAWFMAFAVLVTPLVGAQEATPVSDGDPATIPVVGSISVAGLMDGGPAAFSVTNAEGQVIMQGVLDRAYLESHDLVATPGTQATLVVPANSAYLESVAVAVADGTGRCISM